VLLCKNLDLVKHGFHIGYNCNFVQPETCEYTEQLAGKVFQNVFGHYLRELSIFLRYGCCYRRITNLVEVILIHTKKVFCYCFVKYCIWYTKIMRGNYSAYYISDNNPITDFSSWWWSTNGSMIHYPRLVSNAYGMNTWNDGYRFMLPPIKISMFSSSWGRILSSVGISSLSTGMFSWV